MMDPALKKCWVEALRSGEYAQTAGTLRRVDNDEICYCCLGVLYTVETGNCPQRATPDQDALNRWQMGEFDRCELELMNDGGLSDKGEHYRRHSFAEIADWIEEHL